MESICIVNKKVKKNIKKIQCQAINKNKMPCKCLAKDTIYCNKHISCALDKIIFIQKWWKKTLPIITSQKRGIGYIDRTICNNEEDFYTLSSIMDIPDIFFITYHEKSTKKVWGFDIRSLYNLFINKIFDNPYTTIKFHTKFVRHANTFIEKYKNDKNFNLNTMSQIRSMEEKIVRNTIDLFIEMNSMGYYCNHDWLIYLPSHKLIKFYYEFKDIIFYRANLTHLNIIQIFGCPNPFVNDFGARIELKSVYELLDLINNKLKMILSTNLNNKDLGILLFLTALTTTSYEAALSLDYLQQASFIS
jgi:hypothetical protein